MSYLKKKSLNQGQPFIINNKTLSWFFFGGGQLSKDSSTRKLVIAFLEMIEPENPVIVANTSNPCTPVVRWGAEVGRTLR